MSRRILPDQIVTLMDWSDADRITRVLEPPKIVPRRPPDFVCDLSGAGLKFISPPEIDNHASFLVQEHEVLLFGPNFVLGNGGRWTCESRAFRKQFLRNYCTDAYKTLYQGRKPSVSLDAEPPTADFSSLKEDDVVVVDKPVFLATPLEPDNWGRWIDTVVPKAAQYHEFGMGRRFLCRTQFSWQRRFLELLGIDSGKQISHDPGKTYSCSDVMSVEYSVTNLTITELESSIYSALKTRCATMSTEPTPERIYVSRRLQSAKHPMYRALQNEAELVTALEAIGFHTIEPETLPIERQVTIFSKARSVVVLGGAALFNCAFCPPGANVVTIESSDVFINGHSALLSSAKLRYGIVFGAQDRTDTTEIHKRWTINVPAAIAAIRHFLPDGALGTSK